MKSRLVISSVAIAACTAMGAAKAVILEVPYQYPTITEACYGALTGDTVAVYPGTYNEGGIHVRPGVTVLGMGSDSTAVQVVAPPLLATFSAVEGETPVLLENMELRGYERIIVFSSNDSLRVHRCYLHALPADPVPGAAIVQSWRGSAEIRGCHIEFGPNAVLEHIFVPYRAGHFVLEDCVVEFPEWTHMTLYPTETPPQTVYEFANNTILGHSSGTDTNDREFSVYLVNNILWDYNCGLSPQARPEVLEFRFNCFMYAELQPDCGYQIGNFVADPLFCGPAAGDYRLQPGSPCIGAGEGGENVGARLGICWPTDVEEVSGAVAHRFSCKLSPNPTTGGVAISLDWVASASDHLHIEIFDVTGKLVRVLGSPDWESKTCAYWDGRLADGRAAPAGVYHVGVHRAGGGTTRRLIMLR